MKRALIALTLISCGIAGGTQERPRQIRVSLQFIEVPHSTLTEMLAGHEKNGQALHDRTFALSKAGQAKLMETCMLVCRSGEKATLESIREEIYPTEYQPPGRPCGNPSNGRLASDPPINPAFRAPTAFETRNTGVTFEVEPLLESDGTIDPRLSPEIVNRLRLETWMEHVDQWGDGSIRMPIYESWRFNTSVSVAPGKFELITALTPKTNAPAPAVTRKILVFVRADVLPAP
jgi:hypothetical protein